MEKEPQGELRNIKPPISYGENTKGDNFEAWLLEMRKYLKLHSYYYNMDARIPSTIYTTWLPFRGIN